MNTKVRENSESYDAMAADFAARAATALKLHQRSKGIVSERYLKDHYRFKQSEYEMRKFASAVRARLEGVQ
jgi:uncharacterized protein YcaQ